MKKIISKWYLIIPAGFILFAALIFGIFGEDSIISVHDNLDLFIAQFQMLKNTNSFFAHGAEVPFLGGISRDNLPSEFSLYTVLFMILPSYWAYVAGYLLKIVIAVLSSVLLAKDFCRQQYEKYRPLVYITALSYGILNVFPAFGIPFASIPLVIYLVRRIYKAPSFKWYAALFFYPLISYFSYFGLFILAYMAAALIWLWIRDRKFPFRILLGILVLAAGCIACEYRLFGVMLFGGEETIRSTMEAGSFGAGEIIKTICEGFTRGMFHAESVHTYLVMPVCLLYFIFLNASYIKNKNYRGIFHDVYNLLMLVLVFNSIVYGIYYWEGFRKIIETLCPPLTGWQFNRTIFFSPFIWYAAFFMVLKRLYDEDKKWFRYGANALAVLSVLVIVLSGTRYNDLYHTCKAKAYEILKGKESNELSFGEFYSAELFEKAKEDLGYCGQWSAAYGFHPAVLEYNDISTIDGYLGFYEQYYKEDFRKVIAPALERMPETKEYFDTWGARAYLYSGSDASIVGAVRDYQVSDNDIYIDIDAFKAIGGRYIFSRIELSNAEEAGLTLAGTYTDENSPYILYVYQTASRYQTKEHSELTFDEMKMLTYDLDKLDENLKELEELARKAEESGEAAEGERVISLYESVIDEITKASTCHAIAQIEYYKNVFDEENGRKQQQTLEDCIDMQDRSYSVLARICQSPYKDVMETVLESAIVESLAEYEEMTDEEKELYLKENSLEQEYEQAAQEEYTIEYNGEEWNFERLINESESLDRDSYIDVYQGLYREKNSVLGEIYLELLKLRTDKAKLEDYGSFAEYAYSELYIRDYTVDDARELFGEIRKEVVPVVEDMKELYYSMDLSPLYHLPETTAKERLLRVRPYLDSIDSEMTEAFDYMEKYQLYDMDASEGKADTGFTVKIPYYNDAFIFDSPYNYYSDYTTAIHEFGHYNYMFHNVEDILLEQNNIDLCEIHSQGLEMLYHEYNDELLDGEAGGLFQFVEVYNMSQNTIQAALISELEIQIYQNPNLSLEDINKLYLNLSRKYGIYYDSGITELYSWVDIPHIFTSPCYYIGYSTSAFTSLDLLTLSEENRHEAVEKYMELTTLPTYEPYCAAIEYVGLRDIFEDGVPADIMEETSRILEECVSD